MTASDNKEKNINDNETVKPLLMDVGKMEVFNFALYENDVPLIRNIRIQNNTADPIEGLVLHITSDYPFFKEYAMPLPAVPPGKPVTLTDPYLIIDGNSLAGLTESVKAVITIELRLDDEVITGARGETRVLAYDQFQGTDYIDYLPAFVMPNHPVIPGLIHDAAEILKEWGRSPSIDGYQSHDPNRVRDQAAAAFAAIQKKNIIYCNPPASLWEAGQKIRTPEIIMEQHLGTCMDMTLLYAACLEAMGLNAILYLIHGHIFAGVWLTETSFKDVCIRNNEEITKRMAKGSEEISMIECTAMCSGNTVNFEDAEYSQNSDHLSKDAFEVAIDLFQARVHGIKPMPSRMKGSDGYEIHVPEKSNDQISKVPTIKDIIINDVTPTKHVISTKEELWESKLLDLSQHNMLLKLPLNASVEPLMSSHVDELEDALADGEEFRLLPTPEWIVNLAYTKTDKNGKESKPIHWLTSAIKEVGIFEMTEWPMNYSDKFRSEFRSHRLYTFCTESTLDKDLTGIYRAARASQQENGVSSLYLAIGLLRWFETSDTNYPCYAPLILVPVEIVRKSANQGYALHMRDEEPHFNMTLLEMLKQNYNIEIGGLDPLPADEHGIDINKVFAIVRGALFTMPYWDVVETCAIGNFSFAQFAMWNDIHNSKEWLEGSKIVRSLMRGYVDFDATIPQAVNEEKVYLTVPVDATQLQAIKMASYGCTFVLHGPPGTGKSQTITAMIANLMAKGKTVLFVAEKMAALTVVQKRLSQLGIGDFCLELHSDKASKKQVLTQLEKALNVKKQTEPTDFKEYLEKIGVTRERLDRYTQHLHAVQKCGYTLRELIDLYETVRNADKTIPFDDQTVGRMTQEMMKSHEALIGQLAAAGSSIENLADNPLKEIGIVSYTAETRNAVKEATINYGNSLTALWNNEKSAAELLGFMRPSKRVDYEKLDQTVAFVLDHSQDVAAAADLLSADSPTIEKYLSNRDALAEEKKQLLDKWSDDFLDKNITDFKNKYDAASRKFFGKNNALNAVRNELQAYAKITVEIERIPALLHEVKKFQEDQESLTAELESFDPETKEIINQYQTLDDYEKAHGAAVSFSQQAEKTCGSMDRFLAIVQQPQSLSLLENYHNSWKDVETSEAAFNASLKRNSRDEEHWLQKEYKLCQYIVNNQSSLKDWILYNRYRSACIDAGLAPVVNAFEQGMSRNEILPAYKKGVYYALIDHIINNDDVLSSFSGATFNETIRQFKELDHKLLEQTRWEILDKLADHVPTAWEAPQTGAEVSLLKKAIGSNARGMSIRALFERIPHILKRLAPCMLMSPNSVAQYLEKNNHLFDVVIFDEASQLPTCKAVGALARAENAVIVGDPKQMPPTSFFAGSGPQVDDLALDDLDSILDDALALGIPSQYLQWHYRSLHESLIAFSNTEFYGNKMYTFPSANDRERHVKAFYVEGIYAKGVNLKEAEAVVEEIIKRYHDPRLRDQSIGVVTFNVKQQALIENLLGRQYEKDAGFDTWANSGEDALFVKNLENVQGDERDVILFSIGYGPDEKGRISMNFGPINRQGGGKRLNVAFSRARMEMIIFESMHASDIVVTQSSPDGVKAFRDFLRFAEGHGLPGMSAPENSVDAGTDGITQSIVKAITDAGYQCETSVGHSDFRVDIAVIDPQEPTEYLLGIMLDGDAYQHTKYTRDREVAQIGVLRHLGWNICRIWTIDWWDNRTREINKLMELLDRLNAESKNRFAEKKEKEAVANQIKEKNEKAIDELKSDLSNEAAEVVKEDEAEKTAKGDGLESDEPMVMINEYSADSDNAEDRHENTSEATLNNENKESGIFNVLQELKDKGCEIIDKRENGGALWITGGEDITAEMNKLNNLGVYFTFKEGGGKATKGKDAWWTKADIHLDHASVSDNAASEEKHDSPSEAAVPAASAEAAQNQEDEYILENYVFAELAKNPMSTEEYTSNANRSEIQKRAEIIVNTEGPIRRDLLIKRIISSFGMNRTNAAVEATDKALKGANIRNAKLKGVVFCWRKGVDPNSYRKIRVIDTRDTDEIAPQELKNAVCYALIQKGPMEQDRLIKEVSSLFGYKRLGKKIVSGLEGGLQYARSSGAVTLGKDKKYYIKEQE